MNCCSITDFSCSHLCQSVSLAKMATALLDSSWAKLGLANSQQFFSPVLIKTMPDQRDGQSESIVLLTSPVVRAILPAKVNER